MPYGISASRIQSRLTLDFYNELNRISSTTCRSTIKSLDKQIVPY